MGVWSLNLTGDWQLGEEMNIYRSHSRLSLPLWLVSGSTVYRLCRGFLVDTMMLENARGRPRGKYFLSMGAGAILLALC